MAGESERGCPRTPWPPAWTGVTTDGEACGSGPYRQLQLAAAAQTKPLWAVQQERPDWTQQVRGVRHERRLIRGMSDDLGNDDQVERTGRRCLPEAARQKRASGNSRFGMLDRRRSKIGAGHMMSCAKLRRRSVRAAKCKWGPAFRTASPHDTALALSEIVGPTRTRGATWCGLSSG